MLLSTCQRCVNFANTSDICRHRVVLFGVIPVDMTWSRSWWYAVRAGGGTARGRGAWIPDRAGRQPVEKITALSPDSARRLNKGTPVTNVVQVHGPDLEVGRQEIARYTLNASVNQGRLFSR